MRGTWRVLTLNLEVAPTLALRWRRALLGGLTHLSQERKTKNKNKNKSSGSRGNRKAMFVLPFPSRSSR